MPSLHVVDATYELFRAYTAVPSMPSPDKVEVNGIYGLISTILKLLRGDDVTHVACATDHVVESFRNAMFDGYKTGEGLPEALGAQFPLAEEALRALGLVVWPMVEFEADDALATASTLYAPHFERIVICTPDKDLAQSVKGNAVVMWDRRREKVYDELGVLAKWGVLPRAIPDYLALVGDTADGIPGVPAWGAKSSANVLGAYGTVEAIPSDPDEWTCKVRGAKRLAASLVEHREAALLYKQLATLRADVPLAEDADALEWQGVPREPFKAFCARLGFNRLAERPHRWAGE